MIVIGALQQAAEERLDADDLEVFSAHQASPDGPGGTVGLETEIVYVPSGDRREHGIFITDIAHFGVGKNRIGLIAVSMRHHLAGMRNVDWPQDQCLQDAEDDDVGGYSERKW